MLARLSTQAVRRNAAVAGQARRAISVQSLLHGSPEAKQEGDVQIQQHSRLVARGKYVHGFEVHKVKPSAVNEYKKAAEAYYTAIKEDPELHVKLTGSWEAVVGEQDTFYHILEYENYSGYDKTTQKIRNSEHINTYQKLIPYLTGRSQQLCQEFAFFPTIPPRTEGGIFELRTYQLHPGALLQWEHTWRRGIEARRKFVAPVGAWFSQVGRLHQVHHMWQYPDLHTRKETREKAWQVDGWSETVSKTAEYSMLMDAIILEPLPFSMLK
ncbi:NIPSNAP-domain-containing protein [Trametes coccinea BRFM310]|uniref:NIPSNAP-domain-containing protein n=1 Tax=Trametes coccinea (strain BRFM310) TaxID=1353009 RepID=A0A1Y2J046_TRAC3|nr:NIPSNAP-domain-containing protein [Trametes coccinea BRFM310]